MNLCIIKSASKDSYFQDNLKLLRLQEREEIAFAYRALWVDDAARNTFLNDPGSRHMATIIYCDPPHYNCVPIREAEVWAVEAAGESIRLFLRCRGFVDPEEAAGWAVAFRNKFPRAGTPDGKFVVELQAQSLCPRAPDSMQNRAWCKVIDTLTSHRRYSDCFFFRNTGLRDEEGHECDPNNLIVNREYRLGVYSYNKHLTTDVLRSSRLEVVTDATRIMADLAGMSPEDPKPCSVPSDAEFVIEFIPTELDSARIELCVIGRANLVSRIKIGVNCRRQSGDDAARSILRSAVGQEKEDALWGLYTFVRNTYPENRELRIHLLDYLRKTDEKHNARLEWELATVLYESERYEDCAALLDGLSDDVLSTIPSNVLEWLVLAYMHSRHKFPHLPSLPALDFATPERRKLLQALFDGLPAEKAVDLIRSIISESTSIHVDEEDVSDFIRRPEIASLFKRVDDIRAVALWLSNHRLYEACYSFSRDRLVAMQQARDDELLRICTEAGMECQGSGFADILVSYLYYLIGRRDNQSALELMRRHRGCIRLGEYSCLLEAVAETVDDPMHCLHLYLDAAKEYCDGFHDIESAKRCCNHAFRFAKELGDDSLQAKVDGVLKQIQEVEERTKPEEDFESALNKVRSLCRGKRIALIGGETFWHLKDDLEEKIGCEVTWYPSNKSTGLHRKGGLADGLQKTAVVVKLNKASHPCAGEVERKCNTAGIPFVFSYGTSYKVVVLSIARDMTVPIANGESDKAIQHSQGKITKR